MEFGNGKGHINYLGNETSLNHGQTSEIWTAKKTFKLFRERNISQFWNNPRNLESPATDALEELVSSATSGSLFVYSWSLPFVYEYMRTEQLYPYCHAIRPICTLSCYGFSTENSTSSTSDGSFHYIIHLSFRHSIEPNNIRGCDTAAMSGSRASKP